MGPAELTPTNCSAPMGLRGPGGGLLGPAASPLPRTGLAYSGYSIHVCGMNKKPKQENEDSSLSTSVLKWRPGNPDNSFRLTQQPYPPECCRLQPGQGLPPWGAPRRPSCQHPRLLAPSPVLRSRQTETGAASRPCLWASHSRPPAWPIGPCPSFPSS